MARRLGQAGRERFRSALVYFALVPAIAVAAGILGYYSWLTATQFAQLGDEAIAASTLLLVREKVDIIEQYVIAADNAVLASVDLDKPDSLSTTWRPRAAEISPSVRAVMVLDDAGSVIGYSIRGDDDDREEFEKVFVERIMPDLELQRLRPGRLKHLHRDYGGKNYLISYRALIHNGRRMYVALHHDTAYIVREEFPRLFATDEGKRLTNVVDEHGHRVYGPSLAHAGDYLVGHRFPTTLYGWRLQVAPKQAPLLDAQGRSRRHTEVGLIGTSFLVILLGISFLLWASAKERKLNALKAEFIANVSHELKTPLTVVRMFSDLLRMGRVASQAKREQYVEIICTESERLSALIDNVLDFSALERGRLRYQLRLGDPVEVLERALETYHHRMEREGTEIRFERPEHVPALKMDAEALLLAVVNLLDNAVKYGGGTDVELSLVVKSRVVEVRVRDHGEGIPKTDLRRVFERFYRGRRGAATRGIGLSLVARIAEAHGGRARARNAEDGGAIVSFTLPIPHKDLRGS
ncbi:MAG: HAMP domain-containing histidine kinase [Deltaproteobacteria bacterium]|nr:HAMP domain-containing histidine kinase [Deltaproteobacteria bacterium]